MPDPTTGELLRQGLIITVLGLTLVFAGLGLLWGVMEVLMRVMPAENEARGEKEVAAAAEAAQADLAAELAARLTAERAQVAAIVASMVLAHALPGGMVAVPPETVISGDAHGEPWINTYRARSLQSWQPSRVAKR